ncbi:MAG: RagB/SusD family nutrient uptake outer membrane protein [Parabacteroides sp.]|nr:RagB/SusD family nutrient uptake outer membrane protein [Parabacteroides sp.]
MKNYIATGKKWGLAFVACAALASCASELDQRPQNFVDEDILTILNSDKTQDQAKKDVIIQALCANLESNFRLNGNYNGYSGNAINSIDGQEIMLACRANDIVVGAQNNSTTTGFYTKMYDLSPENQPWRDDQGKTGYNYAYWALPCDALTNANKVLSLVTSEIAQKGTEKVKNGRASALCVRAYAYMLLMERYQKAYLQGGKGGEGMPIYKTYGINDPVAPSSSDETYNFINGDLDEAIALFKEAGTGEGGYTVSATNDIDLGVAQYLKARVAMWTGNYAAAISACNDILAHYPNFIAEANYGVKQQDFDALQAEEKEAMASDNAFTYIGVNPECILGWVDGNGASSYYYGNFNPFSGDGTGTNLLFMRTDDRLYNQIDDNDYRKDNTMPVAKDFTYFLNKDTHTLHAYTNIKWGATICLQQTKRTQHSNTDKPYIRSSEVVLMLAEAYAEAGQEAQAKSTLNTLLAARTRTGAPTMTCDNYKGGLAIKDLIKLQWRIEMWGENGLEFLNLKRWGKTVDRAGSIIHWRTGSLAQEHMTYMVPMEEYNFNAGWGR